MSGANPPSPLSAAQRAFLADRLRRGAPGAAAHAIPPRGHTGPVPLSLSQERLWFLHRWDPESSLYNEPMAFRLHGPLSVPALAAALRAVVERHEVLRTRFDEEEGGRGVQIVEAEALDYAVEEVDEAALPGRLAAESARPFDLRAAPPFRARLWRVGEDQHVLLLCSHHIVTDAWSREVLVRELWALYNGYAQGRPVALPGLPVQYADFAAWQRARVAGGALDGAMKYWVERLRGAAQLELPADRPRPAEQSFRGAFLRAVIPEALTHALGELGRAEGCTPFMVLLAAFKALLARWSGSDDVSVGTPVAGRSHEELEGLIGFFINTLVLRTDLGGAPSFRELLARVKETAVGAYRHQEAPFERLVEALHPERDLARNPLFQVFFVLQNAIPDAAPGAASSEGLRVQALPSHEGASKFDLSLYAVPRTGGIQLSLEYATDLFDAPTAERLLERYLRLLERVVAEPDRPLTELELISPEERRQVVAEWNGAPSLYPRHRCIHEVIAEQAARTPDAPAVESDAVGMTYAELETASDRMAHLLRARGVRAEDRVAILLERTPELLVAILGVLKAGAAYVPLDPDYPAERLAYLVQDSGAAQLVTSAALAGLVPDPPCPVLCVDDGAETAASPVSARGGEFAASPASAPGGAFAAFLASAPGGEPPGWNHGKPAEAGSYAEAPVREGGLRAPAAVLTAGDGRRDGRRDGRPAGTTTPENLAYVIYTSGSTGKPKGAMNTHAAVMNRLLWMQEAVSLRPGEGVMQKAALGFDVAVWELLLPLMYGARVVLTRPGGQRDPEYLCERVESAGIAVMHFVPSLLPAFLDAVRANPARVRTLRHVVCSGEALPTAVARSFTALLPGVELWNLYGPTEAAIDVTGRRVLAPEDADGTGGVTPLGNPLPGCQVYALDPAGRPTPVGMWGELFLGGVQLGRGYLGRPALTAGRWVPDPFSAEPGARLYRSGDRGRWRADGTLEFGGRLDEQVKLRGHRIEPGEIEGALLEHPAVRQAAVILRRDGGEERLAGYVVPQEGMSADVAGLRAHLAARLPAYMVPAALVPLDRLPLTPNGKLDRGALPRPEYGSARGAFVAPRTHAEEVLAAVWSDVLRVERVGVHDNFFHLGGDSILSLQVVSRAAAAGVRFPARQIFQSPTLGELAAAARLAGDTPAPAPLATAHDGELPLSPLQEGILFHALYDRGSGMYFEQLVLPLDGELRADAFRRAWEWVVARNGMLRTSFVWMDRESPRQRVEDGVVAEWVEEDADEARLDAFLRADRERGFDPAHAPLLRFALFRTGPAAFRFVLSFHHLILDGWSLGLVLRDVFAAYHDLSEGREPQLEPRPGFGAYLEWLGAQDAGAAEAFWRTALAGFEAATPLAARAGTRAAASNDFAEIVVRLSAGQTRALEAAARRLQVTVNTLAQGMWAVLLGAQSGENDVVFGATVAGRPPEIAGVDRMLGVFINTLPVRARLDERRPLGEWLGELQLQQAVARQFEATPLRAIQAASELPPGEALFQSLMVFENFPVDDELRERGTNGPLRFGRTRVVERSNYPLSLVVRSGGGMEIKAIFDLRRFDAPAVERMLERYTRLLDQAVANPERRLGELELLSPDEHRRVVADWNRTAGDYPRTRPIHALVAEQAARTPDAPAVRGALTYAQLDGRAGRLAHLLRERGIGAGDRVGVLMERGPELVVALLAVLKAGAAYVPLDPTYPADRLGFMLRDSGAALLVGNADHTGRITDAPCAVFVLDDPGATGPGGEPPGWNDGKPAEAGSYAEGAVREGGLRAPAAVSTARTGPESLAYVVYTSGSTGTPKGVAVPHRAVVRLVQNTDFAQLGTGDVVGQASTASFDAATWEIWGALTTGASLAIVPREALLDPPALASLLRREGVTALFLTTALFNQVARQVPGAFAPLRHLLFGGEQVDPAAVRLVLESGAPERLLHVYGPTENTTFSTWHRVDGVDEGAHTVPIGRAVAQSTAYVLDQRLRPVPAGAWGELYVGGDGVASGYLGRARLTAERFVPDPFSREPGARMYRTGDRVRWSADGAIEFGGRFDQQVKIRGFRIEPGEIEAVLREHPAVRDAAVVPRRDGGETRLVGYLVTDDEAGARAHLRQRLPEYMIPSALVALPELPLTANGKLDRARLPAPDVAESADGYVAPRTAAEEALAAAWAEVLGRGRVGVEDNFFEIGGDSILAIQVVARAARAGLSLNARLLFEHQTVAALAAVARPLGSAAAQPDEAAEGDWAPLLPVQRWFFDQDLARPGHYNQSFALEVPSGHPADHWRTLLAALLRAHPGLRLRFGRDEAGEWRQRAVPADAAWDEVALDGLDEDAQRTLLREHATRMQASMDPEAGPLFGAVLARRGGGANDWLVLVAHHLGVDGVSWRVLAEELARTHTALLQGQQPTLDAEPWPLTRWARALARIADDRAHPVVDAAAKYWNPLRARAAAPLPHDGAGGGNTEDEAERVHALLGADETRSLLQEVPSSTRARVEEVLASALARVLGRWCGGGVWVEMEGHGRAEELVPGADLSRTVGWFTTLYPVWLAAPDDAAGALRAAKEQLRAVPDRGIGYGLLRATERGGEWPHPAVVFNYLGQFDGAVAGGPFSLAAVDSGPSRDGANQRSHELEVTARVVGGQLRVVWTFGPALHQRATVERLAGEYVEAVRALIRDSAAPDTQTLSPSDFPGARLDQGDLDRLARLLQGRSA